MGTVADRNTRETQRREYDHDTKTKISKARDIILKNSFGVNSSGVELLLKPTSLVPARVSSFTLHIRIPFDTIH